MHWGAGATYPVLGLRHEGSTIGGITGERWKVECAKKGVPECDNERMLYHTSLTHREQSDAASKPSILEGLQRV